MNALILEEKIKKASILLLREASVSADLISQGDTDEGLLQRATDQDGLVLDIMMGLEEDGFWVRMEESETCNEITGHGITIEACFDQILELLGEVAARGGMDKE